MPNINGAEFRPRRHDQHHVGAGAGSQRIRPGHQVRMPFGARSHHRVVGLHQEWMQSLYQSHRRRVLHGVGVFLVGQSQHCDHGVLDAVEHRRMQGPQRPVAAITAVVLPGAHHPDGRSQLIAQVVESGEIALEVAAGNAHSGTDIGIGANAAVEPQRRNDFAIISADIFAQLGDGIGAADLCDQNHVDRNLTEFRAFVAHRQNRAFKRRKISRQRGRQRHGRIGTSDDEPFGIHGALDGAAEDQRFDLIVARGQRALQAASKARRHLAEDHQHGGRRHRRIDNIDQRADLAEIAGALVVGGYVRRDIDHIAFF